MQPSMLTQKQEKWIDHLSEDSKIKIVPFDTSSQEKFEKVRLMIQSSLSSATKVEHHGATRLGISGQDEIDIYIPVSPDTFDNYIGSLKELFGEPKSHYSLERARFVTAVDGKHIDVFLVNETSQNWLDSIAFENYLLAHPEALQQYKQLKESGDGLSMREYYRNKTEFINTILAKT